MIKSGSVDYAFAGRELLKEGKIALSSSGSDTPELDAEILLSHTLGITRMTLLADPPVAPVAPETITSSDEKVFRGLLNRRAAGEPVAYIIGYKDFYNHTFLVNRATLIPRPETEIIVEETLRRFAETDSIRLLDIGTGCGCIALSLAVERPGWEIVATDISNDALAVSKENSKRLGVKNVDFLYSNLFENVTGKFDAIVSNPPYVDINEKQNLQIELRDYEPQGALFASDSGLEVIKKLICNAPAYLKSGGVLLCEIGFDQSERVESLFDKNVSQGSHPSQGSHSWSEIGFHHDLAGHMRVVSAVYEGFVK